MLYENPICEPVAFERLERTGLLGTAECLTRSPAITESTRQLLCEWLIGLSEEHQDHPRTLSLSLALVDAYLERTTIPKNQLQLLGMACYFLANKIEETFTIETNELSRPSPELGGSYTEVELWAMERQVCTILNFHLILPTRWRALEYYQTDQPEERHCWQFLCECSYLRLRMNRYSPSIIATAIVKLTGHSPEEDSQQPGTLTDCLRDLVWTVQEVYPTRSMYQKRDFIQNFCHALEGFNSSPGISLTSSEGNYSERHVANVGELQHGEDFKIQRLLGEGVSGKVYRAVHREAFVALKKSYYSKGDLRLSTVREAAIYQQIRILGGHSHLLEMRGVFFRENRPHLVLEYLPRTLRSGLISGLTEKMRRDFPRQLTSAVAWLHQHGILHRDIKPENILITDTEPSQRTELKLADLGSGRSLLVNPERLTTEVCTLWYRAPEVLLGHPYTTKMDCWSSGCIISEIWTGRALFTNSSELSMLVDIFQSLGCPTEENWPGFTKLQIPDLCTAVKPRPLVFDRKCPVELRQYLQRSLIPCPERRASSAELLCILSESC